MKKPFLFLTLFCFSLAASAQKVYFAYFQSDDQSPFYVKLADKVFNSASAGYLTVSNLKDTSYTFLIGFSSNPAAEKKFIVRVNGADLGLSLKNLPDGPQLFDMQNAVVIAPFQEEQTPVVYETRTDRFSAMLSKAADDPGLLQKPVPVKPEPQPKEEQKKDVAVAATETPVTAAVVKDEKTAVEEKAAETEIPVQKGTVLTGSERKSSEQETASIASPTYIEVEEEMEPEGEFQRSRVRRYSETSTTEGFGVVYHDNRSGGTDTIRLLIPNPKVSIVRNQDKKEDDGFFLDLKAEKEKPAQEKEKEQVDKNTVAELPVSSNIKQNENIQTEKQPATDVPAKDGIRLPKTLRNSNCADEAAERDFFRLRRNMAGKMTDEEMIDEAKKFFKKQCFTTEQLRHLSSLFLTSAGKYQFFDAAFEYTSDKENFSSLQSEIRDPYYLNRFKALVGE